MLPGTMSRAAKGCIAPPPWVFTLRRAQIAGTPMAELASRVRLRQTSRGA